MASENILNLRGFVNAPGQGKSLSHTRSLPVVSSPVSEMREVWREFVCLGIPAAYQFPLLSVQFCGLERITQ
jgi:hypothetical protein